MVCVFSLFFFLPHLGVQQRLQVKDRRFYLSPQDTGLLYSVSLLGKIRPTANIRRCLGVLAVNFLIKGWISR